LVSLRVVEFAGESVKENATLNGLGFVFAEDSFEGVDGDVFYDGLWRVAAPRGSLNGYGVLWPVDGRVVLVEPVLAKDQVVRDWCGYGSKGIVECFAVLFEGECDVVVLFADYFVSVR